LTYSLLNEKYQFISNNDQKVIVNQQEKVVKQTIKRVENISSVNSQIIETINELSKSVVSIIITKNLNIYYYTDPFSLRPYVERKKKKV